MLAYAVVFSESEAVQSDNKLGFGIDFSGASCEILIRLTGGYSSVLSILSNSYTMLSTSYFR